MAENRQIVGVFAFCETPGAENGIFHFDENQRFYNVAKARWRVKRVDMQMQLSFAVCESSFMQQWHGG